LLVPETRELQQKRLRDCALEKSKITKKSDQQKVEDFGVILSVYTVNFLAAW